jgi:hypothetical protein
MGQMASADKYLKLAIHIFAQDFWEPGDGAKLRNVPFHIHWKQLVKYISRIWAQRVCQTPKLGLELDGFEYRQWEKTYTDGQLVKALQVDCSPCPRE